ncbi:MAG: DNA alkylation repair protein [Flavitalea sp.]
MAALYSTIHQSFKDVAIPEKAAFFPRFFKSGKGEYGEGDFFLGVTVPDQRTISKHYYKQADKGTIEKLINSKWHEERLTGLFILMLKYKADKKTGNEQQWVDLYLANLKGVNNWDLVDCSAAVILGDWLENRDRKILYAFARSNDLWKNRISIISCLHFIKKGDLADLLKIAKILLPHKHDLIHKAIGWMLREGWKKDPVLIEKFLQDHYDQIPRTALRYAIEKMSPEERQIWLKP